MSRRVVGFTSGALPAEATLVWVDQSVDEAQEAHEIVIMSNGWLRVTWLTGSTVHVSPAAVKVVFGKGVSYSG